MLKRRMASVLAVLCFCVLVMSFGVKAASVVEPIATDTACSLTVSYRYGDTAFSDMQVKLYRVAAVAANAHYTPTPLYEAAAVELNGLQSTGEWDVVRSTLEAYIVARGIEPDALAMTDTRGEAHFDTLQTGMYLAVVAPITQGDLHCRFDAVLVALPGLQEDGRFQYAVAVNAKPEALPPVDPDEEIEYAVLKLWRGDEGRADRPKQVEVSIFCNGDLRETVVLSADNQWSHTWVAKDDGAVWSVAEANVPAGYAMTVEERARTFVLTNTRIPTGTDDPPKPPQTGETTNVMLYVLLLMVSGTLLIVLGVAGKRTNV